MSELPTAIEAYLCNFIADHHSPAYLLISKSGDLLDCGGDLARYGLQHLHIGGTALAQIAFLEGLLPLVDTPLFLLFVKHGQNPSANIHIFSVSQGDWVLFLDAEDEENRSHNIQKPGNLFSLMRQQQLQLNTQAGSMLQPMAQRSTPLLNDEQCAILCVHIGSDTVANPSSVTKMPPILDLYLGGVGESIWSESGVIAAWMGNIIVAIFGLCPTEKAPQQHAFEAGLRILEGISSLPGLQLPQSHRSWGVGIMIRSEVPCSHNPDTNLSCMMLRLIAQHMSVLMQWVTYVPPYEILIDPRTFGKMGEQQDLFVPSPLVFQDEKSLEQHYSYRFRV